MDLTKLSTADLQALQAGDLSKVSTQGLQLIQQAADPARAAAHQKAVADTQAWAATVNPTDTMGPFDRWAAGTGKGMTDLARGAGERLGIVSPDDIAASRQQDAPLMATSAGKVGNITGKVATALPATLIPGANTLVGAALLGGAQGALEPTTADESVLKNIASGAAGGGLGYGAGKVIGAAAGAARAAAQPFYEAGRKLIVGNALNRAAGADAPAVANQLEQAAAPFVGPSQPGLARETMGELVPGAVPTVMQAAGNPGVAALGRAAVATNPDVTNAVTRQVGTQNAARAALLEDMAGSGGARDFAAAERAGTSDQLYGVARANGVDAGALTPEAQANIAQMQARVPQSIINYARELAAIKGEPMNDTTSVGGLHYIKTAIDAAIDRARSKGDGTMVSALTGLQRDFLAGMDNLSPDYAAARATHAAMSEPINQMDVAQALLNSSRNPLTEAIQPAAYARALSDRTAAGATGLSGATLDSTMTNQQGNLLQSILADVRRSNAADNVGRVAGSDTVQKLAYANMLDQAGVPTFMREFAPAQIVGNLAAQGGKLAYSDANKRLANQLAETMLSPADAAAAMRAATEADTPNPLLKLLAPYLLRVGGAAPAAVAIQGAR